ncbi:hypothetical protein [Cytobacillus firmus]|uniref:hypothetical protein n=1 Tax=Cytobacillus firmus TaxID=1399 RepID=UPI0021C7E21B|nr:hypothetical protein [Cytobacillus firmus]
MTSSLYELQLDWAVCDPAYLPLIHLSLDVGSHSPLDCDNLDKNKRLADASLFIVIFEL